MAKRLFNIVSKEQLRHRAAQADAQSEDGLAILAAIVIAVLDARGEDEAEATFCERLQDYFYNLAASSKRRFADALAIAYCNRKESFDELWEFLKSSGVTGRTYTRPVQVKRDEPDEDEC